MDKSEAILYIGFTLAISLVIVWFAMIQYDISIDIKDSETYLKEKYLQIRTCDELQQEIDDYDRYILRSPPDYVIDAYREKCQ